MVGGAGVNHHMKALTPVGTPASGEAGLAGASAGWRNRALSGLYRPVRAAYVEILNPAWFAQRPPRVPARGVYFYGTIMTPVCVYIDGFNLYHALLKFGDARVKWLDLNALSHRLVSPKSEKVQSIFYFSAFAHWLPDKVARHGIYVKALQARGVTCILGHFKSKDRRCKSCGATWVAHEEKETDVSIGINLLNDAYKQRYEKAYLVTRDSDLMPAVRMIRTEFPTKEIVAVAPPLMGHSNDLITVCHSKQKISPDQVKACLLPEKLQHSDGTIIVRPLEYR
jgi:hypothetical protein